MLRWIMMNPNYNIQLYFWYHSFFICICEYIASILPKNIRTCHLSRSCLTWCWTRHTIFWSGAQSLVNIHSFPLHMNALKSRSYIYIYVIYIYVIYIYIYVIYRYIWYIYIYVIYRYIWYIYICDIYIYDIYVWWYIYIYDISTSPCESTCSKLVLA